MNRLKSRTQIAAARGRMIIRLLTPFLLSFALLGLAFPTRASHPQLDRKPKLRCEDISGSISASITSDTTVLGTVTGDLRGAVMAMITGQEQGPDGKVAVKLEHIFVTESGDLLRTTDQATLTPIANGVFRMTTNYNITGGTGKFLNAEGALENHGEVDFNRTLVTLRYRGRVCTPSL